MLSVCVQYEMNWWKQPYLAIGDSGELISIAPVADHTRGHCTGELFDPILLQVTLTNLKSN